MTKKHSDPASGKMRRKGAALLIVLSFLVLLSAVVLALFATVRNDRQNAGAFASGQETLRLAETAVNLVQGQIRDATIQPRVGWASQPGMVRAFDTSNKVTAYKLYSSDNMVVADFGKTQMDAEAAAMANWNVQPAHFADLNTPAVVKRPDPADANQFITTPVFPIADPAAIGAVEGFSATTTVPGTVLTGTSDRRLPMPVKWVYVLKDGQLIAPTAASGSSSVASFSGNVPTQANPIVGRIAFWADDDTCKLNINTASEGTFWDVPRANTQTEERLGISMPVKGEFQRLSGHPATTSLSPVLAKKIDAPGQDLLPRQDDIFLATNAEYISKVTTTGATSESYYTNLTKYTGLTPKVNSANKSSMAGLYRIAAVSRMDTANIWPEGAGTAVLNEQGNALVPDTDRLYATPDEILFATDRSANAPLSASEVSKREFFLTSHSRAPETTLFGSPRVSLWPQQKDALNKRNAVDRLIAFCSQVGKSDYFFQRDIAMGIAESTPPADQTQHDVNLPRNQQLFGYLRNLTMSALPGYGGAFTSKWGSSGVDKVLAQTFDVSRANVNEQVAQGTDKKYSYSVYQTNALLDWDYSGGPQRYVVPAKLGSNARGAGRFMTISQAAFVFLATDVTNFYGATTLANPGSSGGSTTYNSIRENLRMNEAADGTVTPVRTYVFDPSGPHTDLSTAGSDVRPIRQQTNKFRTILVFQPLYPNPGNPPHFPGAKFKLAGDEDFSVRIGGSSESLGFFGQDLIFGTRQQNYTWQGTDKALGNPQYLFTYLRAGQTSRDDMRIKMPGSDPFTNYAYVSKEWSVPSGVKVFDFVGRNLKLEIRGYKSDDLIQTINFNFPDRSNIPIPQHVRDDNFNSNQGIFDRGMTTRSSPLQTSSAYWGQWKPADALSLLDRMRMTGDSGGLFIQNFIRPGDVVLGVQLDPSGPAKGDFRLLALEENVPSSWFAPHPNYSVPSEPYEVDASSKNLTNLAAAMTGRFAHAFRNDAYANGIYAGGATSYGQVYSFGWRRTTSSTSLANNQLVDSTRPRSSLNAPDVDMNPRQGTLHKDITYNLFASPIVPFGMLEALNSKGRPGDWASGNGNDKDGGFFVRFDSGNPQAVLSGYFGASSQGNDYKISNFSFEPNRYVPSAGILAGVVTPNSTGDLQPWQTLLASPNPAAGRTAQDHPGFATPPDHAYLDNFWMPVCEPYPISEPLSTAGKINLNSQLMPFSHIGRTSAIYGILKPILIGAVPNNAPSNTFFANYKAGVPGSAGSERIRQAIDVAETIIAWNERLTNGEIYRSASQVCEIPLVPKGRTAANVAAWWDGYKPTSDTLREQPYTALLSRVTTKSNTFTVHYRVQALRQAPRGGGNWAQWQEGKDQVVGEYRGASTVERFLDPNAPNIPDYTTVNLAGNYDPIDKWYRWRVLSQKQFAP